MSGHWLMSRKKRKKQRKQKNKNTQKSASLGNWSPLDPWINNGRGDQFSRTKWGAAQSYIIIGYVEKCVELISSGITSLPYMIKRFERGVTGTGEKWQGTEIARSDDPIPQHPLFQLIHNYEDHQHMSLLFRMAASLTLFDELYVELVRNVDHLPVGQFNPLLGLDWLNPLGMSINALGGGINQYFYSPFDTSKPTSYEPFEIAYKHGYNPEDDLRGYPDVLAVIESLEIDFAIQTSVVSHFRNGIQGSAVVSPKDGSFTNLQATRQGMEDVSKRSRGVQNVGNFMYWPKGVDVTALPYPDYSQITSYVEKTEQRILNQFGVPQAMLGNSDIAGYKQGDEVTYRFYVSNIIPRAEDIVKFFNRRIIPLLPAEYHLDRLVIDRSEFDRVSENDLREAEIAGKNLQNTVITINEARVRQGLEEWEKERGDLLIVPPGTVFISPGDLVSGFIAGGTPEEAAVVSQTSDVDGTIPLTGDEGVATLSTDEHEDIDMPDDEHEDILGDSISKNTNLVTVKSVMSRSQQSIDEWEWTVGKAHKELDAWYKYVKRRGVNGLDKLSEFEPNYTRGDIADTVIESFKGYKRTATGVTVKAIFEMVKDWVAIKAIQATRIDFEDDFEDALQAHIDGNATPRQASARLRSIIRKANNKAFRDGLSDGGAPGEEPTDAEQVEINQFIREQSQFVSSLLKTVKSDKLASSTGKGVSWFNKSVKPMYDAGLASAGGNKMVEWVLGKTETHCRSCSGYNGQRHRFKSWLRIGAMPQSDTLACNGFNCDCNLVPVKAKARGKLKLIKSIQELMKLKAVNDATKTG
jgi:phage portal protein BeeE